MNHNFVAIFSKILQLFFNPRNPLLKFKRVYCGNTYVDTLIYLSLFYVKTILDFKTNGHDLALNITEGLIIGAFPVCVFVATLK